MEEEGTLSNSFMRPEKDSTRQYKESKQQITISDEYRYENN